MIGREHLCPCKLTVCFIGQSIYMARCHQSVLLKRGMLFTCKVWCICLRGIAWKLMTMLMKNMITLKEKHN